MTEVGKLDAGSSSSREEYPLVSVIIPTRNEGKYIEACLSSILRQTYPLCKVEILVVDGMSEDGTRDIISSLAQREMSAAIRLLENPKKTTPIAMNIGIRNAKGDVIIIIGGHARVASDFIQKNIEYLRQVSDADCVGGPVESINDSYTGQAICLGMTSHFGVGNANFRFPDHEGYVDTVAFGAYRREVFDRIGLFDEELIRNQDDELNYRLTKSGRRIYMTSEIKSYYYPRPSLTKLWRQYYQYGYWKVRVIQKHRLPASWRHLVPASFMHGVLGAAIWGTFDQRGVWLLAATLIAYGTCSIGFSVWIAFKKGWKYFPLLPMVFAILHWSYGVGFLKGIWDFVVWRRHRKHRILDMALSR